MQKYLLTFLMAASLTIAFADDSRPLPEAGSILAIVGNEAISPSEFKAFKSRVSAGMQVGETPLEIDRNLLEALIDMKLLLREAHAQDIASDPVFQKRMDEQVKSRLLKLYRKRQIVDKVLVTDEELHRHYRATHRDRALRLGGIMVETREEAQQVVAALEAGADFQQLARERSLHQDTGEHGGDSGTYKLRDQTRPTIAEKVFHLEIGKISEPVPFSYEGQKGYVVFKVLDAISVPLESSEQRIREELISWKMATRTQALLDSLREEYAPRIVYNRIPLLSRLEAVDGSDLADSTAKKALCTFKGGQIALADFLQNAQRIRISPRELADSSRVVALLKNIFIPERLFLQEAKALGLDQDPELLDFLSRKREELLISLLRQREVDQHTTASDEEAQAFFDAHPEKFTSPETIVVTEILVPSDSLAHRLKRELQEGADATPLAVQHTMREGSLHHSGNLRLNVYTQAFYPSIYEAAQHLEVGEVGGPVPTGEGYSVFRVIDRGREKESYNADTQRRARAYVKIDKAKRGYVHYVRDLRQKYSVTLFEENVAEMQRLAEE
ncbi:MAG: hypothetical protein F4X17_18300 [Gemmatimonadetes bacterium]|nr:hypothetical protein [Gemmatimonadota bacterium]